MINYQNGKKLVTVGFAFSLIIVLLNVAITFFGNIIMGGIGGYLSSILDIISIFSFLSVCLTAGGFGIMWLSSREMLDLAPAALLALSAVAGFFLTRILGFNYAFSNLITGALSAALYLVLAIRVKDKNRMLFLLFGCAVLFRVIITLFYIFMPGIPSFIVYLIAGAGNIVCAALCFLASRLD